MFDFQKKQAKRRILTVSGVLLFALILSNFASTNDYNKLEKNMSSLYKDRLMPSYYLFQINDHLYQERMLQRKVSDDDVKKVHAVVQLNNQSVDSLIKAYTLTYLTPDEKKEWAVFITKLKEYHAAGNQELNNMAETKHTDSLFAMVQLSLNRLSKIQASEGELLQSKTKTIVYGSVIYTYLQVALMIILIIIILMTVTSTKHLFLPADHRHLMN